MHATTISIALGSVIFHKVRGCNLVHSTRPYCEFPYLEVLVWFLLNIQNKPERWNKLTAELRQSRLMEGAFFIADFVVGFAADFLADFSANSLTDVAVVFLADFAVVFSADFSADFRIFRRILLGSANRFFFKTPCKTKDLRSFLQDFSEKFPHNFSLLVDSLLFSGLTQQSHPQALQILGMAGRHATVPMLRGMLVC